VIEGTATSGLTLVWNDEFDDPAGTVPNPERWSYQLGDGSAYGSSGWGNEELQHYTDSPENACCDGAGNLAITARHDGSLYTSARIVTSSTFTFTYGRIETRLKVPRGAGLWPAAWALGANVREVGWPECGEIDVMEHVARDPRAIYGTIHGPGYCGDQGHGKRIELDYDVADDFHTYAVDWSPETLEWCFDGEPYLRVTPADLAPNRWVFDHPFYVLLNLAVGGHFGGPPAPDLELPQSYLVDYVRVYQREGSLN
jgi:beta-glucanase (GH16 family)